MEMVFKVIRSIDLRIKKQNIKKTARSVNQQLLLRPNDAQLYLTKAVNLAQQASMILLDGPPKQRPARSGNFSADLANTLLAALEAETHYYEHIESLLAQTAEAAYLALNLAQEKLPTPPVEYYWEDWRQKTITRTQEALSIDAKDVTARAEAYKKALRWMVGVLSQNPLDPELCYQAALLLLSRYNYDYAALFFLCTFALIEEVEVEFPEQVYEYGLQAAEKVRTRHAAAQLLQGSIFLRQKAYEKAEAAFKRVPAFEQEETSLFRWISYRQRAKALAASGQTAEAAELQGKAEQLLQQRSIKH